MSLMKEKSIKREMCHSISRHAEANNKYMED